MTHDLITIAGGVLYCLQCKQTWEKAAHHLARQTECVGGFSHMRRIDAESLGAKLIDRWLKETGRE